MGVAEFIMIGTKAHIMIGTKAHGRRGKRSIESLKRHLMEKLFSHEAKELRADNTEKIWFSWCKLERSTEDNGLSRLPNQKKKNLSNQMNNWATKSEIEW